MLMFFDKAYKVVNPLPFAMDIQMLHIFTSIYPNPYPQHIARVGLLFQIDDIFKTIFI